MATFEIINPSDPYIFDAPTREVATLAVAVLSDMYGVREDQGEWTAGPFTFMGKKEFASWFREQFGAPDFEHRFDDLRGEIGAALATVRIPGTTRETHDDKRTSISDIGRRAWAVSAKLSATPNDGGQGDETN